MRRSYKYGARRSGLDRKPVKTGIYKVLHTHRKVKTICHREHRAHRERCEADISVNSVFSVAMIFV